MKKVVVLVLLSLVVFSLGFSATKTIGFCVSTLANPFFVTMKDAAEATAKEMGFTLIVLDAQDSPERQISQVQDLIIRNVDALVINPVDSDAIGTAVLEANRYNVPVITVTRPSRMGKTMQHLDIDNSQAGRLIGEELAKVLGGKGRVAILEGIPGAPSAVERQRGFLEALKVYPEIQVVTSLTANYSREQGANVMEDILQANPVLDAVYAHNDQMALGAVRTIAAAGRTGEIKVFGIDAIDDAVAAILKGEMSATVKQQPGLQIQMALESAIKVLAGETVEELVIVPLKLITLEVLSEE